MSVFLSQETFARIFYVSNSGSDSRTLAQAQNSETPWATLSKVQSSMSSFTSGDSILFKRGDAFSGILSVQSKTGMFFGAYGNGNRPLFWGTGSTITTLIRLRSCNSVVFRDWDVSDTTISFTDRTVQAKIQRVFIIENGSTSNVVKNFRMDRIGYGFYITAFSNGQTIDSCDIGNLRMIRNTPRTVNADDDYGGVPIQISSRNNIFTNNYLHDCYSLSYDYGFDGGGIEWFEEGDTISGNEVMYNTFYANNGTMEHGSSNDGIINNPIQNNTFAYNRVINCEGLTYVNNRGQYITRVKNLMIYNNIIIETVPSRSGSSLRIMSMATTDTTVGIINLRNNIFRVSNGASLAKSTVFAGAQLTHVNNLYQVNSNTVFNYTLDPSEISSPITTAIWVNTTTQDPIGWNYNLIAGSPAINAGINVGLTRDYNNQIVSNPPDIGILEYNVVTPPACTFTYSAWTTCSNGSQSRTYTISPAGCTGTPPADSLVRSCTITCTFTYSAWSACIDSFQSRTFTKTPSNCTTNPPGDSILRKCNSIADTCTINFTTATTRSSCVGKADGIISLRNFSCSSAPYTITLTRLSNGAVRTFTTSRTSSYTIYNLFSGTYTVTLRDVRGNRVTKSVVLGTRSSATFCR